MVGDDASASRNGMLLASPGWKMDPKPDLNLKISQEKGTRENRPEMLSLESVRVHLCSPHTKQELVLDTSSQS